MLIRLVKTFALAAVVSACGSDPDPEQSSAPGQPLPGAVGVNAAATQPLDLQTDLLAHPVAAAVCTRGNSYARLKVSPEGLADGVLLDTEAPISGTMVSRDTKTVLFTVETGTVGGREIGEAMQITTDGRRVLLTGTTFVCRGVEVHALAE